MYVAVSLLNRVCLFNLRTMLALLRGAGTRFRPHQQGREDSHTLHPCKCLMLSGFRGFIVFWAFPHFCFSHPDGHVTVTSIHTFLITKEAAHLSACSWPFVLFHEVSPAKIIYFLIRLCYVFIQPFFFSFLRRSHYIAQASHQRLRSRNRPASASWVAGTTGMYPCAQGNTDPLMGLRVTKIFLWEGS